MLGMAADVYLLQPPMSVKLSDPLSIHYSVSNKLRRPIRHLTDRLIISTSFITPTVKAAYGVSWLYLIGDVSYETYKAKHNGPTALDLATGLSDNGRLGLVAAKRGM
jgi:hypothetical protein